MTSNPCITAHAPHLQVRYDELLKSGLSEKEAAIKAALEEHQSLFKELNDFKKRIGISLTKGQQIYVSPDTSQKVKEITDTYAEKIKDAEKKAAPSPIVQPIKENQPEIKPTEGDKVKLDSKLGGKNEYTFKDGEWKYKDSRGAWQKLTAKEKVEVENQFKKDNGLATEAPKEETKKEEVKAEPSQDKGLLTKDEKVKIKTLPIERQDKIFKIQSQKDFKTNADLHQQVRDIINGKEPKASKTVEDVTDSHTITKNNLSEIDNVKGSAEVKTAAKKIAAALIKLNKDAKVILHNTEASFQQAFDAAGGEGRAGGFFDNGNEIHLNMKHADVGTAFHEGAHAVFKYAFNNSKELTDKFHDQLNNILPDADKKSLRKWVNDRYADESSDVKKDEFVTEFFARVASGKIKIDQPENRTFAEKVKNLLRATAERLGLDPDKIGLKTPEDVRIFAKKISDAFNEGKNTLKAADKSNGLLVKLSAKASAIIAKVNAVFETRDGKAIGFNYDTDKVARERFDFSKLTQIGKGSDRTVFDLGDGRILKVAHTARGLEQNIYEGDYYLKGIVPEVFERGVNYVVTENIPRIKAADVVKTYDVDGNEIGTARAGDMIKELGKFSQRDFDNHTNEVQDALAKYGFSDILSYNTLYPDFVAARNWGYKDGTAVHIDGGTFGGVDMITSHRGKAPLTNPEFREIYYQSRQLKKQYGDTDKNTKFSKLPTDPAERKKYNREVDTNFINDLKDHFAGKLQRGKDFNLGAPTEELAKTGIPDDLKLELTPSQLIKKEIKHSLRLSEIVDLPSAIREPIAVFQSMSEVGSKVILTELKSGGKNFIVSIKPNSYNRHGDRVNDITSVYPKNNVGAILSWIGKDDLMEYANKEKVLNWIAEQKSNPSGRNLIEDATNIANNFENKDLSKRPRASKLPGGRTVDTQDMPDAPEVIDGFYSPIEKKILNTRVNNLSATKWLELFGKKNDETIYTGVKEFLEGKKPNEQVTKKEIYDYMQNNRLEIREVVKGTMSESDHQKKADIMAQLNSVGSQMTLAIIDGDAFKHGELKRIEEGLFKQLEPFSEKTNQGITKFETYQLAGEKENYQEVLITQPQSVQKFDKSKVEIKRNIRSVTQGSTELWYNGEKLTSYSDDPALQKDGSYKQRPEAEWVKVVEDIFNRGDRNNKIENKAGNFISSHFPHEPNILAHIRMNDRVDAEGNKVKFLEEVQSDWGQKGKREGFETPERKATDKKIAELWDKQKEAENVVSKLMRKARESSPETSVNEQIRKGNKAVEEAHYEVNRIQSERMRLVDSIRAKGGGVEKPLPSAPFVTDTNAWTKLGLKYALKSAVESGAEKLAWTTGEQQNDRYNLSKLVNKIEITKSDSKDGAYDIWAYEKDGEEHEQFAENAESLESYVGEEIASKVAKGETIFEGEGLQVGGKGMKGFYGEPSEGKEGIIGGVAKALVRELTGQDSKIVETKISADDYTPDLVTSDTWVVKNNKATVAYDKYYREGNNRNNDYQYFSSKEEAQKFINKNLASTQHSIEITPELRAAVLKGMPKASKLADGSESKPISELKEDVQNLRENAELSDSEIKAYLKRQGYSDSQIDAAVSGITPPPTEAAKGESEGDGIKITHAATEQMREELGMEDYEKNPQTEELWKQQAEERIANGDMQKVLNKMRNGDPIDHVEQVMMGKYIATLDAKVGKDPSTENMKAYQEAVRLSDAIGGTLAGRSLRARQISFTPEVTYTKMLFEKQESIGGGELTENQKADIKKKFDEYEALVKVKDEKLAQLEEETAKLKAELSLKDALGKRKTVRAKNREALEGERKEILDSIREKLRKARGETNVTPIPYAKELFAIAPDVAKLVRNLLETGTTRLADIVDIVYTELQAAGTKWLTKKDVNDLIAGEYNAKKPSRDALVFQLREIKEEAKLIAKLEQLENGVVPVSESKKRERNKQIAELRNKIFTTKRLKYLETELERLQNRSEKEKVGSVGRQKTSEEIDLLAKIEAEKKMIREEEREANKFYKDEKVYTDENPNYAAKLKAIKTRNETQFKKIAKDIANKNFDNTKKPKFDMNKAMKHANPKLWKEAMDAIANTQEARNKFALEKQRDEFKRRGVGKKLFDWGSLMISTTKVLKAGIDDSVTFIQLGLAIMSNPKAGVKAKWEALQDINSKRFKRQLIALHQSPRWGLIKDSGLDITEPQSLHKDLAEEIYSGNLLNRTFTIRGKRLNAWTYTGGIFERLFTSMGNNMRLNLFLKQAEHLEGMGMTFESHPQEFKDAARVINEMTARGKMNPILQRASPVITPVIWAPRMLASSLNMLGVSDLTLGWVGKGYYQNLTTAQKGYAFGQMAQGIGMGIAVMAAFAMRGWDVDDDPHSTTFGTIGKGTRRYNVFGRFSGVVKTIVQIITGTRRSKFGEVDLDNPEYGGKTGGNVIGSFARGKMTPFAGLLFDLKFNAGKNFFTGEKINTPRAIGDALITPISVGEIKKGLEQDGSWSLLTRFLPAFEGMNVTDERDFKSIPPEEVSHNGEKVKLTDEQGELLDKRITETKERYKENLLKTDTYKEADKEEKIKLEKQSNSWAKEAAVEEFKEANKKLFPEKTKTEKKNESKARVRFKKLVTQ